MLRSGNHDLNHFHTRLEEYLTPLEQEVSGKILKHLCSDSFPEKELYDAYFFEVCDYEVFQEVTNRLIYEGYSMRDMEDKGKLRFVSPLLQDWWSLKTGVR